MQRFKPNSPSTGRSGRDTQPQAAAAPSSRAESQFYARQIERSAPVLVHLRDGEILRGSLEWYDRASLRLNLEGGGHRIIQKAAISTIGKGA